MSSANQSGSSRRRTLSTGGNQATSLVNRPPSAPPLPASPNSTSACGREGKDELDSLRHQLRLARAEIANLQIKSGVKPNPAPFGSSTPRNLDPLPLPPPHPRSPSRQTAVKGTLEARPSSSSSTPHHSPSPRPQTRSDPQPGAIEITRALMTDSPPVDNLLSKFGLPTPTATTALEATPMQPRASSRGGGSVRNSAENPFFGSGASRERMANSVASASSGSGKVISALQSDLMQAKSALESARAQLRLSQRAVDFLSRQNLDLKETKERLSTETEGLSKMIARKERLQEEALRRAKVAESTLASLQQTYQEETSAYKSRLKLLEESTSEAELARAKAESEYNSLRAGMKSMSEGWKADLEWLKSDLRRMEGTHKKELDDARLKHSSLTKLFKARESAHSDVNSTLAAVQATQREFSQTFGTNLALSIKEIAVAAKKAEESERVALELTDEYKRFRRIVREHDEGGAGAQAGATLQT